MYCSKCGYKNAEKSKFCINCGKELDKVEQIVQIDPTVEKKYCGLDIASMVLGILAVLLSFSVLCNGSVIEYSFIYSAELFGYIFGTIFIQTTLAVLSLVFACCGRKTKNNGFNTAGLCLAISAFAMIFLTVIIEMFSYL